MASIKAGRGTSVITPREGSELLGYGSRKGLSIGVHDGLHSPRLVVEGRDGVWALCANELACLSMPVVAQIHQRVSEQVDIPPGDIHICTVHTHSGPYDDHPEDWNVPLVELIADAIVQAHDRRVPALVGAGRGWLGGYTINRRFIDRPTDPGMAVLRVEDLEGKVLGLVVNWNCHAVVLGYDNLLISADFPGVACTDLEQRLGAEAVVLYVNGGAGNINPLVSGVRTKLTGEYTIDTSVEGVHYYGTARARPTLPHW